MPGMMKYKGYHAQVSYDPDIEMFRGEVTDTASNIDFYADTVEGLKCEFERSLHEYLAVCRERGIEPEKGYSGRFVVRAGPALHALAAASAAAAGESLNAWVVRAIEREAERKGE